MTAELSLRIDSFPPVTRPLRAAWRGEVAALASSQDDLVTAAQLRASGVPSSTASGRSRDGGYWTRVLPGVYLVTGGRPDRRQRERAALLYSAPHGILAGASALRHLGVRAGRLQEVSDDHRSPEPVQVLMPHAHHLTATGFLEISRTRRWPTEQVIDGFRLSSTARAVADLARRARSVREVSTLVDECLRRGLTSLDELFVELSEGPRQGSAYFRAALNSRRQILENGVQGLVQALVHGAGLTDVMWQVRLVGPRGEPVGTPIAWVDSAGLAIEVATPDAASIARQQRYAAYGVNVFPVAPQLLHADPEGQTRVLALAARQSCERPRPRVFVLPP